MDLRERYPRSSELDRAIDQYRANLTIAFEGFGFNTDAIKEISEKGCDAALVGQDVTIDKTLVDFVVKACCMKEYRGIRRVVLADDLITIYPTPPIDWNYYVGINLEEARYTAEFVGPHIGDVKYVIPSGIRQSISTLPALIASCPSSFAMSIRKL